MGGAAEEDGSVGSGGILMAVSGIGVSGVAIGLLGVVPLRRAGGFLSGEGTGEGAG